MRFLRSHGQGGANSWGLLVSADNGRTWSQRIVEKGLSVKEWVTEPSLVDLGGGRLLIVGRCEQNLGNQFQVTSVDGGKTWKKSRTNIGDVSESTPSLVYDAKSGSVANYYYQRGARKLKRRFESLIRHFRIWPFLLSARVAVMVAIARQREHNLAIRHLTPAIRAWTCRSAS